MIFSRTSRAVLRLEDRGITLITESSAARVFFRVAMFSSLLLAVGVLGALELDPSTFTEQVTGPGLEPPAIAVKMHSVFSDRQLMTLCRLRQLLPSEASCPTQVKNSGKNAFVKFLAPW